MEHTARSRLQTHLHNGEYCASLGEGASCSENAGGSAWFSWKLSFCARLKLFLKLLWRCSFWNQEYIKRRFSLLWWLGWKSWVWRKSRYEMSCGSIKLKVVEKVGRKAVHSFAALKVTQRIGSCTLENPEFKVTMWKKRCSFAFHNTKCVYLSTLCLLLIYGNECILNRIVPNLQNDISEKL